MLKPRNIKRYIEVVHFEHGVRCRGIDDIVNRIQEAEETLLDEGCSYLDIGIEATDTFGWYNLFVCGNRMETDEEFQERVDKLEMSRKEEEERERKRYEELKAKFEPS